MNFVFVFQSSRIFLKRWKNCVPKNFKVYFLLGRDASVNIIPLAKKKGWHPVDISKGGKWPQQQIKEEYLDLIASFNQWNAEIPYWWATHFSSKNRINSPVLPYLKELHQILSAIEDLKRDESLVLLDISWPVIETLKVLVSKNGYKLKICFPLFFTDVSFGNIWTTCLEKMLIIRGRVCLKD